LAKLINKNTYRDKWDIVSKAIDASVSVDGLSSYKYLLDVDDEYVYFDVYNYDSSNYVVYRATYTYSGTTADIGTDLVEVVRTTEYKVVNTQESLIERAVTKTLSKLLGSTENKQAMTVIKQFEEEKMEAIEAIYISKDAVDEVGDAYADPNEVYDMVDHINKAIEEDSLQPKLFHVFDADKESDFKFVKAWVTECDCMIGDTLVEEGTPLIKVKFFNEDMWEDRKAGELMGLSIGANVDEIIEVDDE
jgi:hypothetical protein